MTYSGRSAHGWSSWLAVMLYIFSSLVSTRLSVPNVYRVGWRNECRMKQWREGKVGNYESAVLSE